MASRKLVVYMFDEKVGVLTEKDGRNLSFKYSENAKYPISISMPIRKEMYGVIATKSFFEGLLPEGMVRDRLQKTEGISNNTFSLLEVVGGECAGAISLFKDEESKEENGIKDIELSLSKLEEVIKKSYTRPLLRSEGIRLSLAGAQPKLAIRIDEKSRKFFLPNKKNMSTHIIKPPITWVEGIDDFFYNELFCLRLFSRMFMLNVHCDTLHSSNIDALVIKRYDRTFNEATNTLERIHQEDTCQAMSISSKNKYQKENGRSSIKNIINFFREKKIYGEEYFLKIVIFNYLIGNSDAHGKNFSILHFFNNKNNNINIVSYNHYFNNNRPNLYLAPAYDLVSTCIYHPKLDKKMAMKIGGEYNPDKIYRIHFQKMAKEIDVKPQYVLRILDDIRKNIVQKAVELKEEEKKYGTYSPVFGKIIKLIESRVKRLSE